MGKGVNAITLVGPGLDSVYSCPIESEAKRLGIEEFVQYPSRESDAWMSLGFVEFRRLLDYAEFACEKVGVPFFAEPLRSVEGVITHEECKAAWLPVSEKVDQLLNIKWEAFECRELEPACAFEFLSNVDHDSRREMQRNHALLNRRLRLLVALFDFAVKNDGFIDFD
ncbi:hypothetical protein [Vibrio barjaei]|uniref:hypothetical protein n=1 Tax=Vibrio barjaei TaxID=1676683 RepID=UPI0022835838|nr:hypothetical protein [Vibrio barjaei]MCY9872962.1 hypothetical protein [Vibrio barjaei]